MTEHGVTCCVDDGEFYIRHNSCAVIVRCREEFKRCRHCGHSETTWLVEISDCLNEEFVTVFRFSTEEDATEAAHELACHIDKIAEHKCACKGETS